MLRGIVSCEDWREDSKQVIGPRRSTLTQQQPLRLQVVNAGDGLQQTIVGLPLESQLAFDVRIEAKGVAQRVEAPLVVWQSPIAKPNRVAAAAGHGC